MQVLQALVRLTEDSADPVSMEKLDSKCTDVRSILIMAPVKQHLYWLGGGRVETATTENMNLHNNLWRLHQQLTCVMLMMIIDGHHLRSVLLWEELHLVSMSYKDDQENSIAKVFNTMTKNVYNSFHSIYDYLLVDKPSYGLVLNCHDTRPS